jgi:stearoyl-CoA desaturase (delta-9 desaturase)
MEGLLLAIGLGFLWSTLISHWAASILLHRYYCHRQFKVPVWYETIGLFMLMVACVKSPIGWIASHRMHHVYSDTEKDPHSPNHLGFWKVFTTTWDIPRIPLKYAKDLYSNPRLVFCHNHWFKILMVVWIISFLIHPLFFIGFALVPFIHAKIGFGLINTVGHADGPTNAPWINLLVAGEGYHQEHHKNFRRIRLHKYDTGGWVAEKLLKYGIFKSTNKAVE